MNSELKNKFIEVCSKNKEYITRELVRLDDIGSFYEDKADGKTYMRTKSGHAHIYKIKMSFDELKAFLGVGVPMIDSDKEKIANLIMEYNGFKPPTDPEKP